MGKMKRIQVARPECVGWREDATLARYQEEYGLAQRNQALRELLATLAFPALLASWAFPQVRDVAGAYAAVGLPLFLATAGSMFLSGVYAAAFLGRLGRLRDRAFVPHLSSNDPQDASGALDLLLQELRSPARDRRRLARAYETAVQRLQDLRPSTPLSALVRYGYYPSRPRITENQRTRTVDHDASSDDQHWNRASSATDALRALLRGRWLVSEREVDEALCDLVPPLRAVLRAHGVETHRIDYMPTESGARSLPAPRPKAIATTTGREETRADPTPDAEVEDELTPAMGRLNASATLTASTVRTLELSFRTAEEDLFAGDDLDTGRRMLAGHLPSLVRAYVVAHDACEGDERDQVRAEFAQSLGVIRDALAAIMRRHAQEARRRMEDETRFIRQRHGEGPLGPVAESPGVDAAG
jgi:hypothetical protein